MDSLKIGLVHMNVRHNQPDANKEELIRLNRQAAEAGAKIIVNTELATSGYSFQSREETAGVVQPVDGPVMQSLSEIAAGHGAYIVLGYVSMYMDMRYASDLTSWYELPKPDDYQVTALMMPRERVFSDNAVDDMIRAAFADEKARLLVLPAGTARSIDEAERKIFRIAVLRGIDVCAAVQENPEDEKCVIIFADASGNISRFPAADRNEKLRIVDTRHARVLLAGAEELMHPETALAAAKLGCDLAVLSSGMELSAMRRQTIAARSVDQLYIAVAGEDCAFICEPPESHYSWKEVCADGGGVCSLPLDFTKSRTKRFYDRLDFDLLLRNGETI